MNTRSSSKNGVQYQWNSVNWFFHVLFQTCRRDVHVHVPCTVFEKAIRNKACKNRMFVEKCLYEYFIVDYKEIRALEVPYAFHHASRVYNIHMNFENCALNGRLTMKHGSKRGGGGSWGSTCSCQIFQHISFSNFGILWFTSSHPAHLLVLCKFWRITIIRLFRNIFFSRSMNIKIFAHWG